MQFASLGTTSLQESIQDRISNIRTRIGQAAERKGRSAADIHLVAVSKTFPVGVINEAIDLGIGTIGESKVQEFSSKVSELKPVQKHFIGSLQTNKARKALEMFDLIQSVDRPKLASTLNRISSEMGKKTSCFVEVKVSGEASKSGMPVKEAKDFVDGFDQYAHLDLQGIMTIAPFDVSEIETRRAFQKCRELFESVKSKLGSHPILSMGMTDDFEMAIEEGSNMVRVGRALFGTR